MKADPEVEADLYRNLPKVWLILFTVIKRTKIYLTLNKHSLSRRCCSLALLCPSMRFQKECVTSSERRISLLKRTRRLIRSRILMEVLSSPLILSHRNTRIQREESSQLSIRKRELRPKERSEGGIKRRTEEAISLFISHAQCSGL